MTFQQTITLSVAGEDYEYKTSMTKAGGLKLDDELFQFLKTALICAGFHHDSVEGFFNE